MTAIEIGRLLRASTKVNTRAASRMPPSTSGPSSRVMTNRTSGVAVRVGAGGVRVGKSG